MRKTFLLPFLLLALFVASPSLAYQELPSVEISPSLGLLKYDSSLSNYESTLSWGLRADLRFVPYFGFQVHMARSTIEGGGLPFGIDDYVSRVQFALTRDLLPIQGFFMHLLAGVGSFNRHESGVYSSDKSVQLGIGVRRNLFSDLYLRGDCAWNGVWMPGETTEDLDLTSHYDLSVSLSWLFDN
ncbi:MAG: hypothetical protein QF492_02450 [Candidatus Krumholzibacteria bacterium]|nr:hypothetical protein [Candidatus Krumholzibacteria bacterium]MDP6668757.1 hypothetical protein [Candidatus Krumholzibacteria bacterium]MDP6797508.1 hypothetical protein [Candidatus Krumholzibacteria bacterium]MDP7021503.1 hypothetical protein [Candidatus Krumholzibacteria bacterium]